MTRKEMITAVAEHTHETKTMAERMIYAIFDKIIPNKLAEGETVSINDFGKFIPEIKPAHEGRNPATGEKIQVEEKVVVKFKPASALKSAAN